MGLRAQPSPNRDPPQQRGPNNTECRPLSYGRGYRTSFGPPVTPQVVKTLMIANCAVLAAQFMFPLVGQLGVVSPASVWQGLQLWRPFTYMWLHAGPMHLVFNMIGLYFFGQVENLSYGTFSHGCKK